MIRWLVIGIGDIARRRVIPAILEEPRSRLQALLTRDPQKAAAYPGVEVFTFSMRLKPLPVFRRASTSSAKSPWR